MAGLALAIWSKFQESHNYVMSLGDPRTQDWPLVRSPLYPLAFLFFFYMPLVVHGPSLMEHFKPVQAKRVLFAFNCFQIFYSVFMWTQFLYLAISMQYSMTCEPVSPSTDPLTMRMAACMWHFYISKIIDLVDTLWFVLRKKERNISFLHVYHHSTQVFIWWIGVKFVPGGHSFFIGCVNSMIHSMMYTYYLISSLGEPYKKWLWWKKHLTKLQMVQFVLIIAHSIGPLLIPGCQYPKSLSIICSVYTISVFVLFLNFYLSNYSKKTKVSKATLTTPVEECNYFATRDGISAITSMDGVSLTSKKLPHRNGIWQDAATQITPDVKANGGRGDDNGIIRSRHTLLDTSSSNGAPVRRTADASRR